MYSYEDRIRAVKLYIKLGKRLAATIRQLGYPTKNSLIGWYRQYEQSRDLQVGYMRSMQKYSVEQKQAAVQHYLDHDRCIASTMKVVVVNYCSGPMNFERSEQSSPERHLQNTDDFNGPDQ